MQEKENLRHLVDMPPLTGVVLSYGSTANVLKAALLDKIDRSQLGYRDTQPSLGDAPYIPGTQRSASPIPRPPKRKNECTDKTSCDSAGKQKTSCNSSGYSKG